MWGWAKSQGHRVASHALCSVATWPAGYVKSGDHSHLKGLSSVLSLLKQEAPYMIFDVPFSSEDW